MANFWGNISGTQAVQMGMNIFNLAQQQALQQRQEAQQQEQLKQENFFRKMQLDMQQQRVAMERERLDFSRERTEQDVKLQKMQREEMLKTKQKLSEFSMKAGDLLEKVDFSDPDDMKKLYALQVQYQPYGVTPKYIKPEIPKTAKPMSQKEYGTMVMGVWSKLKDHLEKQYKAEAEKYQPPGFFGRLGKSPEELPQEPELALPTMEDAIKLTNQMLGRGETLDDLDFDTLLTQQTPQQPQPSLPSPITQSSGAFTAPQSPYARAGELFDIFKPSKRRYNALSADEKRVVDRYVKNAKVTVDEAIDSLEEAKAMKAR